jgi:hypothetical protein
MEVAMRRFELPVLIGLAACVSAETGPPPPPDDPAASGAIDYDAVSFAVDPSSGPLQVGDLDRDGHPDIVLPSPAGIAVVRNLGDRTLAPLAHSDDEVGVNRVALADLDVDGCLDAATTSYDRTTWDGVGVRLLLGDCNGGFALAHVDPSTQYGIDVADMNGDTIPDVVASEVSPRDDVSILLGRGDGTLLAPQRFPTGGVEPDHVVARDVNGDDHLDVVVQHRDGYTSSPGPRPRITVFAGAGDGTLAAPVAYPFDDGRPAAIVAADVNQDGRVDVASLVRHDDGHRSLERFAGSVDGELAAPETVLRSEEPGPATTSHCDGTGCTLVVVGSLSLAARDLDGDGAIDYLFAWDVDPGAVTILWSAPDGSVSPQQLATGDESVHAVAAADMDGDGLLDIVAKSETESAGRHTVTVFFAERHVEP